MGKSKKGPAGGAGQRIGHTGVAAAAAAPPQATMSLAGANADVGVTPANAATVPSPPQMLSAQPIPQLFSAGATGNPQNISAIPVHALDPIQAHQTALALQAQIAGLEHMLHSIQPQDPIYGLLRNINSNLQRNSADFAQNSAQLILLQQELQQQRETNLFLTNDLKTKSDRIYALETEERDKARQIELLQKQIDELESKNRDLMAENQKLLKTVADFNIELDLQRNQLHEQGLQLQAYNLERQVRDLNYLAADLITLYGYYFCTPPGAAMATPKAVAGGGLSPVTSRPWGRMCEEAGEIVDKVKDGDMDAFDAEAALAPIYAKYGMPPDVSILQMLLLKMQRNHDAHHDFRSVTQQEKLIALAKSTDWTKHTDRSLGALVLEICKKLDTVTGKHRYT